VLSYLDVPRDVILNPRLIQAHTTAQRLGRAATLEDFAPTDFSGSPMRLPWRPTKQRPNPSLTLLKVAMAADEGGYIGCLTFPADDARVIDDVFAPAAWSRAGWKHLAIEQHRRLDAGARGARSPYNSARLRGRAC